MNLNRRFVVSALKWITTVFAAIYAGGFLVTLISTFNRSEVSGVNVDWTVPENPQFTLALVLVTATAILWVWRGVFQSVTELLLAGVIVFRLFFWWQMTSQIKANTGLTQIPEAGWIGDTLIGATAFEVLALIATASLFAFAIASFWTMRHAAPRQQLRTLHP